MKKKIKKKTKLGAALIKGLKEALDFEKGKKKLRVSLRVLRKKKK